MSATIASVEAWQHIVDAVLYAITDEEGMAREALARAGRIMPIPDEAYRAVLDVEFTDPALETALDSAEHWQARYIREEDEHAALKEKYDALLQQYHHSLNQNITRHQDAIGHLEGTKGYIDREYKR